MTRRNGRHGTRYNRMGGPVRGGASRGLAAPAPNVPPNLSGNPAGYNKVRFPSTKSVISELQGLGYTAIYNPKAAFVRFQQDYNIVHKYSPKHAPGTLVPDGVPGINTLNGMDWATRMVKTMPKSWIYYVKKFRSMGTDKPSSPVPLFPKPKPSGPTRPGKPKPKPGASKPIGRRRSRRRSR